MTVPLQDGLSVCTPKEAQVLFRVLFWSGLTSPDSGLNKRVYFSFIKKKSIVDSPGGKEAPLS